MILGIPLPTADPDITFFLLCRLSSPILSFCLFWKQHTYPQRPTAPSLISMFVFLVVFTLVVYYLHIRLLVVFRLFGIY